MKLTKSQQVLTEKPKSGSIKTTVVDITQLNSLEDLEKVVLSNPFNVSVANGISEKDWKSQQIFALDFDSGITPKDVMDRCRKLAFIPNIVYSTFSDSNSLRKFRVLFILDKPLEDYKLARWTQKGLMKLFPEADAACKDLCRMYYPGKEILFKSETINEMDWFIQFCQAQVAKNERFWEKFDFNSDDIKRPDKVENYNWKHAIEEVKLLDAFFNKDYRMSYDILFGLITNAQYIYGGEKKIFERMLEINKKGGGTYFPDTNRGIETYPKSYFYSLKAVKKFNYMPKSLSNFSPFEDDHDYKNLLEIKLKKGKVEVIKEQEMISLNSAVNLMRDVFDLAKKDIPFEIKYSIPCPLTGESHPYVKKLDPLFNQLPENPIYIFKITTGAGKSQIFLQEEDALIAFPFHRLKDEMSDRMLVDHMVTPESPYFSDQTVNDTIEQLRLSGLYTEVGNIIKSIAKGSLTLNKINIPITQLDIDLAQEYLQLNNECRESEETVLTTHTRAVNDVSFKHKFYIFDEDPLNDIVDIDSFDIDFTAFDNTQYKSFTQLVETFLRDSLSNCILPLPRFSKPRGFDKFAASVGKGKLIKLLQSDFIYKDDFDKSKVNFCMRKTFLEDKKVFIMSATAPIPIYKKLYGDRVIVIDITNIKPMGVIEQWTKRSFSANGMTHYNTKVYNELFNNLGDTKVITHLKHSNKFKSKLRTDDGKPHGFYFGNCSGGDSLNGYDVSVVGTPNKPSFVYLFMAELIGLPNSVSQELYDQEVEWNDFRFRFFTYEDPTLRDIQLSLIEAELLQAAGRSRFLRNKNTTKIFSSLPLKITTVFHEK